MKALVYLAQHCCSDKTEGRGRVGGWEEEKERAENALNKELHLNVLISKIYVTNVPFSSQDNKKNTEF